MTQFYAAPAPSTTSPVAAAVSIASRPPPIAPVRTMHSAPATFSSGGGGGGGGGGGSPVTYGYGS